MSSKVRGSAHCELTCIKPLLAYDSASSIWKHLVNTHFFSSVAISLAPSSSIANFVIVAHCDISKRVCSLLFILARHLQQIAILLQERQEVRWRIISQPHRFQRPDHRLSLHVLIVLPCWLLLAFFVAVALVAEVVFTQPQHATRRQFIEHIR